MSKVLLIGTGGCGNKLVNTAITILKTKLQLINEYDFLLINSNKNEMQSLKNYNNKISLELIGNGTGRDRNIAIDTFKEEKIKVANYFIKNNNYDLYEIYTSADGGFGSGTCASIAKLIRNLNPLAIINVRAVMPKANSNRINLENAIALYNDLSTLLEKDNIINNVQFINNDKMKNEESFNISCMNTLLNSLELHGGSIDESDILKTNAGYKYRNVIELDSTASNLEEAIKVGAEKSCFIMSDTLNCTHICALLDKNKYVKEDLSKTINWSNFDKIDYAPNSTHNNFIVTSGCQLPISFIKNIENQVSKLKEEELLKAENSDNDLLYKASVVYNINTKKQQTTKLSKIEDIFPNDFWEM